MRTIIAGSRSIIYPHILDRALYLSIRGKDLMCFCSPLACHGDVLLEIANES